MQLGIKTIVKRQILRVTTRQESAGPVDCGIFVYIQSISADLCGEDRSRTGIVTYHVRCIGLLPPR